MSISSFDSARQRARRSDILKGSTAAVGSFDIFINKAPCFHTCCNDQLFCDGSSPRAEDDERISVPRFQVINVHRLDSLVHLFISPQLTAIWEGGGGGGPRARAGERRGDGKRRRRSLGAQSDEVTRVLRLLLLLFLLSIDLNVAHGASASAGERASAFSVSKDVL